MEGHPPGCSDHKEQCVCVCVHRCVSENACACVCVSATGHPHMVSFFMIPITLGFGDEVSHFYLELLIQRGWQASET